MDKINGFEIFEDFMPGAIANPKTPESTTELSIDEIAVEGLTDEELATLRSPESVEKEEQEEKPAKESKKPIKTQKPAKEEIVEEEESLELEEEEIEEEESSDESTVVTSFFDSLSEKFGWDDVEDNEKPKTAEELVEYFQSVIEENSVPQYASEEVEALDNFVKNGGNLKEYFQIDGELNLDDINIEDDEVNQKLVLKEFLKEKGFSSKQIEKKLNKYDEAGLLEDEATDALEALKEIKEKKKQQLLKEQENIAKQAEKRQQEYFNSVVTEIKGLDSIRGIKIPEKDKRQLLEYIFKPTADGQTQYQKDWSKSTKNLLESAYFTMKGDALLKAAKNEGSTNAISKFKNTLSQTGMSRKTRKQENTSTESMWDSFARRLRVD